MRLAGDRRGLSIKTALDEIQKLAGTQFDGRVVRAFFRAYEAGELKTVLESRPASNK